MKVARENNNNDGTIIFFGPCLSFNFPTIGTTIAEVKEKAANTQE
jgi:hypothetical protein